MKRIAAVFEVWFVLSLLLILAGGLGCGQDDANSSPQRLQPTVLLISIDGFRWDYMDRTETPTLDRLAGDGVQARALIPVFPTLTFPNHYTVVTGLFPEKHGIVSNTMYDPVFDATYSLGNREAIADGRWYAGEPIWVTAEEQGQKAATFFWPGSEAEIQGIRPSYWKPYDGRVPHAERVKQILEWLDLPPEKRPTFLTLYFSSVDSKGHEYPPASREVLAAVRSIDRTLGALIQGLEQRQILDDINILITSDHGMAATSRDRIIFLDDYIDLDRVRVVDWGALASIRPHSGEEKIIYRALVNAHPHMRVYRKAETPQHWHYRKHRRIQPIIAVADEGWSITSRGYFQSHPDRYTGGAHGYDNALISMRGIFIAHGPAFKQGLRMGPLKNIHLYALMTEILDLTPAPNAGSVDSVRVMLVE